MNTALNAQNKIKELNVQFSFLFFVALVVICYLFYLGYPPYMLFVTMIVLVVVQTFLKLQLCHKYIGMDYMSYFKDVFLPSVLLTTAMVLVGFTTSFLIKECLFRTFMTFMSMWIIMLLMCLSFFLKKEEKKMFLHLIHRN